MNQVLDGIFVNFGRVGLIHVLGLNDAGVPISNIPVAWGSQNLLPVNLQSGAGASKLLSGVFAAMVLNGQHGVRNDLLGVNLRGQSGHKLVLGHHTHVDDGEVNLRRHLSGHWRGWDKPVLAIGVNVLGSDKDWWHATPVLNHISFEDCLPSLDGDNRVGTVGLKGRGLLNRGISSKVIVPLNREDRSGHVIGPNVGGGGAPERNGVGGDGPVGWVPSFNFLARHSVWGCLVSKKRKNLDTLMPKFKTLQTMILLFYLNVDFFNVKTVYLFILFL